jgi:hypothetical protein
MASRASTLCLCALALVGSAFAADPKCMCPPAPARSPSPQRGISPSPGFFFGEAGSRTDERSES